MIIMLTMYFIAVFCIGFFLGATVHDKLRDIQNRDKNNTHRQGDGC